MAETLVDLLRREGPEFRNAYMWDQVCLGLSRQIKAMREARGWTQEVFAERMGTTQSAVTRLENPDKIAHTSMRTLEKVATTFDVALICQFVDWPKFLLTVTPEHWGNVESHGHG